MKKFSLLIAISFSILFLVTNVFAATSNKNNSITINQKKILANAPDLNANALNYAIKAYHYAVKKADIKRPDILTIVNFNMPAYEKRMWVINLKTSKILMKAYTTQGKNSGLVYARHFSNNFHTDESSLGVYKITNTYYGEHGLSERLQGLEKGVNNNAFRRDIVIHPAWYATPGFVKKFHRTGRSWGCFAINPAISKKFINLTKGGSVLFAYAKPEQHDKIILSA